MEETTKVRERWLVAAWPGMGSVGMIAAGYLVHKLGAKPIAELDPRGHFDVEQVAIKGGVVMPSRMPRSVIHSWKDEQSGRELLIFLGEAQPSHGGHAFANELLDKAVELGANRVMTFAAMASQIHPSKTPRVYGVVTQPDMKADVTRSGAALLDDGQIGGLNGVMLGAAAERGLPGMCLLGEIPFFAGAIANPKTARSVLGAFAKLTGISVDTGELAAHEETVQGVMAELLDRLRKQVEQRGAQNMPELPEEPIGEEDEDDEAHDDFAGDEPEPEAEPDDLLDADARERIEKLFEAARRDKARGAQLKGELDKLGVFRQYEDRFLDLYKKVA